MSNIVKIYFYFEYKLHCFKIQIKFKLKNIFEDEFEKN